MQNCDNLAIDSRLSDKVNACPQLLSLTQLCPRLISFLAECGCCLKSLSPCLPPRSYSQRQIQTAQGSLRLDVLITWHFFLHQHEPKGKRWGLFLWAWGTVPSSSSSLPRQKVQQIRCQMIFNVKRARLFSWHPLLGALLHGTDTPLLSIQVSSNGTQVRGSERMRTYGEEEEQR